MPDCPWDLTGDGVVDDADTQWLQDHWGPCVPGSKGDFNGDGRIDLDDIMILQSHYGPCPIDGTEHAISFRIPNGATIKVGGVTIL